MVLINFLTKILVVPPTILYWLLRNIFKSLLRFHNVNNFVSILRNLDESYSFKHPNFKDLNRKWRTNFFIRKDLNELPRNLDMDNKTKTIKVYVAIWQYVVADKRKE